MKQYKILVVCNFISTYVKKRCELMIKSVIQNDEEEYDIHVLTRYNNEQIVSSWKKELLVSNYYCYDKNETMKDVIERFTVKFDGVVPISDGDIPTTIMLNDLMNITTHVYNKKIENVIDKHILRCRLLLEPQQRCNFPDFEIYRIDRMEEEQISIEVNNLSVFNSENKNKYVLKPSKGSSSIGVSVVTNKDEILRKINENEKLFKHKNELFSSSICYVLESHIEGEEKTFDVLLWEGMCMFASIGDKRCCHEGHFFYDDVGIWPSIIEEEEHHFISKSIHDTLHFLGLQYGCFHIEFKYFKESQKIFIIEINCRMPGIFCVQALSKLYDYNVFENVLSIIVNKAPDFCNMRTRGPFYVGIRSLYPFKMRSPSMETILNCYKKLIEDKQCEIICHAEEPNKLSNTSDCICESDVCSIIAFLTNDYQETKKIFNLLDQL